MTGISVRLRAFLSKTADTSLRFAFSFATKHERAVGIPVVVRAIHIIKKLNIM